ncbi:Equilibrative nucleoside transporter [Trypanosoma melophagium]|uniref:Equilibrative nucleoside transporter n=1 Tax=Trypanosoma melophagium TaxID=715481 RepID=UPI00351A24D6|nr:Equilibrative nucleoside transporter [Trypanosoma melophagium]
MAMMGFESLSEVYCYFTAFMCGISMLLPINAIFSAPLYIMHYYQYVTKKPDAQAENTNFWNNALTYYTLVSLVTSLIAEPLTLTKIFRRIPLQVRMLSALAFLWVEIIVLMVVPAVGSTEVGAIVTILIAGFISGSGKSVFESTAYGLFSAFPHRFMAALMGGAGVAGALTSILQIIVKAALPEDYEGIRVQSKIFYGLMVGIQGIAFIMLILLRWNTYARQYTGALSGENTQKVKDADTVEGKSPENPPTEDPHSTSESLVGTEIFFVLKIIYPMTIACAFNFFITLLLFPTVVVSVDPEDYWYGTVAVCIFNVCDVFGRFAPSLKAFWPPTMGGYCRFLRPCGIPSSPLVGIVSLHSESCVQLCNDGSVWSEQWIYWWTDARAWAADQGIDDQRSTLCGGDNAWGLHSCWWCYRHSTEHYDANVEGEGSVITVPGEGKKKDFLIDFWILIATFENNVPRTCCMFFWILR